MKQTLQEQYNHAIEKAKKRYEFAVEELEKANQKVCDYKTELQLAYD